MDYLQLFLIHIHPTNDLHTDQLINLSSGIGTSFQHYNLQHVDVNCLEYNLVKNPSKLIRIKIPINEPINPTKGTR